MSTTSYPKSFPTSEETAFLRLVLSNDQDFPALFESWSASVVFDDIGYATSRLLPLLYLRLQKAGIKGDYFGRIQGVYRLAWVKNQRLLDALSKVVAQLEAEGIPVLLLKGIPLLVTAYKDIGARFLGDADILIHPRHVKQAVGILIAAGWKIENGSFPGLHRASVGTMQFLAKEATFINDQQIEIDVHWHLFDRTGKERGADLMSFDELWPRAITFEWKGRIYHAMAPEDMLLHIVAHGALGNEHRALRWVADAVAIMRAYEIDWQRLISNAKIYDLGADVRTAFSYLADQGFVELPQNVREAIRALESSPEGERRYRKATSTQPRAKLLGSLPLLWKTYWKNEATGFSPAAVYRFPAFACAMWGIGSAHRLPRFVIRKYRDRFSAH